MLCLCILLSCVCGIASPMLGVALLCCVGIVCLVRQHTGYATNSVPYATVYVPCAVPLLSYADTSIRVEGEIGTLTISAWEQAACVRPMYAFPCRTATPVQSARERYTAHMMRLAQRRTERVTVAACSPVEPAPKSARKLTSTQTALVVAIKTVSWSHGPNGWLACTDKVQAEFGRNKGTFTRTLNALLRLGVVTQESPNYIGLSS